MADKNKLIKHAEDETQDRACPICGNKEWDVGSDTYIIAVSGGNKNDELACAKCTNCGFVAFFSET
jgi:predicted nucleic-acid-binding Zn-ribbon protein